MTNVEGFRHGLSSDPFCPLCGVAPETILHTLRDCAVVRNIWQLILNSIKVDNLRCCSSSIATLGFPLCCDRLVGMEAKVQLHLHGQVLYHAGYPSL
ncbi:hypothetical protein V6N11_048252 [Hibiscus sabdariffa]|uniref:Reverse transcriptase zinc-binding domain-containing protein n=1 Tax=Hibiscus sabdariffa TaxID=183260 RepID=A0ABR2PUP1_9ROSI